MVDWRTSAANQRWHEIRTYDLSINEVEELYALLQAAVPTRIFGDGVEAYEDYILPRDASTPVDYHAALLMGFCRRKLRPRKTKSILDSAYSSAARVLESEGVEFEGFNRTYLYPVESGELLGGGWAQLRADVAEAICERREALENEILGSVEHTYQDWRRRTERWLQLYPWRDVRTLREWYMMKQFEPQTKLGHALAVLEAHYQIANSINRTDEEYTVPITVVIEEAIRLGVHWEALSKKRFEVHALRGLRTKQAASDGGKNRAAEYHERSTAVTQAMAKYVADGHSVSRSAELAFRSGVGTSPGANAKLWQRHKAKI